MAYQPSWKAQLLNAEQTGIPDYAKAMQSGFQTAADTYKPATEASQLLSRMLKAKIDQPKAEDAQGWYETQKNYYQALGNQANRGPAPPADVALLEYLMKNRDKISNFGSDSSQSEDSQQPISTQGLNYDQEGQPLNKPAQDFPVHDKPTDNVGQQIYNHFLNKAMGKNEYAPSNTQKELNEYADAKAGFYPGTNRTKRFESPEEQRAYEDVYATKTTGLKKGSHYILDKNGERIGEMRPKSLKERDIERGGVLFNHFYHYINEGLDRYSGEGSITNMENDAKNYKTDPAARKRFDQLIIADKLRTVAGVNEAARFGAGRTNQTFNRFNSTLSSFDVPKKIASLIRQYQIPASANIKAGLKFQQILNNADKDYESNATPNKSEYYPGKAPKQTTTLLVGPKGEEYDIPDDKVHDYLIKHKELRRG